MCFEHSRKEIHTERANMGRLKTHSGWMFLILFFYGNRKSRKYNEVTQIKFIFSSLPTTFCCFVIHKNIGMNIIITKV